MEYSRRIYSTGTIENRPQSSTSHPPRHLWASIACSCIVRMSILSKVSFEFIDSHISYLCKHLILFLMLRATSETKLARLHKCKFHSRASIPFQFELIGVFRMLVMNLPRWTYKSEGRWVFEVMWVLLLLCFKPHNRFNMFKFTAEPTRPMSSSCRSNYCWNTRNIRSKHSGFGTCAWALHARAWTLSNWASSVSSSSTTATLTSRRGAAAPLRLKPCTTCLHVLIVATWRTWHRVPSSRYQELPAMRSRRRTCLNDKASLRA